VIAWEPPAVGVVPAGEAAAREVMAPIDAHLRAHPGDYVGAQAHLLSAILGVPVSVDDPAFTAARANAEPMIRDEPSITLAQFEPEALARADIVVAAGSAPNDLVAAAVDQLERMTGRPRVIVDAPHEVYLAEPSVLTAVVVSGHGRG
jgi:hypothetical protein